MKLLFLTLGADVLVMVCVLFAYHLGLVLVRKLNMYSARFQFLSFGFWILAGACILFLVIGCARGMEVPVELRIATGLLYFAGILCYMQVLSTLSRGYSLMILDDLQRLGGTTDVVTLLNQYGGGMGLKGMIRKRILGIRILGLAHWTETTLGPLTPLGKILATGGSLFRRLMGLGNVG